MIGEIDWFGQAVGGAPDGAIEWNTKVAKALIRSGLAVVLIEPQGKKAVCTLNTREKKVADTAAQDAAKEAGSPNWNKVRHDCGIKHAITDEKLLTRVRVKELLASGANLAVAVGAGERRVIVVDVDTEDEKKAFLRDWQGDGAPEAITVTSPGTLKADIGGEEIWVHKNGGHFWFDVPADVELPESPGKLTWCDCHGVSQPKGGCKSAWCAYYGSGYVLVPPSIRPEGSYSLTGAVQVAPEWLTTLICDARSKVRAERPSGSLSALDLPDDPIDRWSVQTSWHDILVPEGFTPADHDACGCPTFTRPGSPAHDKSVTGHEYGCTRFDTSKGHGPLRIWSDALGGGTKSKLTYVAERDHGGDVAAAMRSVGVSAHRAAPALPAAGVDADDPFASPDDYREGGSPKANEPTAEPSAPVIDDRFAPIDWHVLYATDFGKAEFLPAGLCEPGHQVSVVGSGKAGKSLFMFEWCIAAVQGKPLVTNDTFRPVKILYFDAENAQSDLLRRMIAFGITPDVLAGKLVYLSFPPVEPMDTENGAAQVMALVDQHQPDVVIIDTVSRYIKGKENDAEPWTALYRLLHVKLKARRITGIRLDHLGKDADKGGRGSSAKTQDIDHEWIMSETDVKHDRMEDGTTKVTTQLKLNRTYTRSGLGPDYHLIERVGIKSSNHWLQGKTSHKALDVFDAASSVVIKEPVKMERPTAVMVKISEYLSKCSHGVSTRYLRTEVGGKATTIDYALKLLSDEGYLHIEKKGTSKLHSMIKPFTGDAQDDHSEDRTGGSE